MTGDDINNTWLARFCWR